jgi:hypothetical protein
MTYRIKSRVEGERVVFRMECKLCGRIGAYHPNITTAERIADLHERYAHAEREVA